MSVHKNIAKNKRLTIKISRFCRKLELSKNQFTMTNLQQFPQEDWKPIQGYGAKYRVSSLGRVFEAFKGLKKVNLSNSGYLWVLITFNGKSKNAFVHRLVAEAFLPNPKNLPQVNHINGIKTDNRLENLEWLMPKQTGKAVMAHNVFGLGEGGEFNHKSSIGKRKPRFCQTRVMRMCRLIYDKAQLEY